NRIPNAAPRSSGEGLGEGCPKPRSPSEEMKQPPIVAALLGTCGHVPCSQPNCTSSRSTLARLILRFRVVVASEIIRRSEGEHALSFLLQGKSIVSLEFEALPEFLIGQLS